jgi:uncharacterized delta-60 repeat protein
MKTKLLFIFLPLFSFSQSLTLDNTFGVAGKASAVFGTGQTSLTSMIQQSDGKIVACGNYYDGSLNQVALARFNTDGSADASFGVNGHLLTLVGTTFPGDTFTTRMQSDGKILVCGTHTVGSADHYILLRYNSNGSLDDSFDGDGILITSLIGRCNTVEVQTDGKILMGGYINVSGNGDFAIARYNPDGTPDESFDTDGIATLNIGTASNPGALSDDEVTDMIIQSDGKIIAAGKRYAAAEEDMNFALARFNADGTLDMDFAVYGKTVTDFGGNESPVNLHMLSNGKLLLTGAVMPENGFDPTVVIAKYDANGFLDTSYGTGGKVVQNYGVAGGGGITTSSVVDAAGKLLVTCIIDSTNPDFKLLRFNTDGSFDNTLDGDGIINFDLGGAEAAQASMFQSDGKLLLGGDSFDISGSDFSVARINSADLSVNNFNQIRFKVYPLPFDDFINVDFELSQDAAFSVDLTDLTGRKIKSLMANNMFLSGTNTQQIPMPENLSSGLYLLQISNGDTTTNIKILHK